MQQLRGDRPRRHGALRPDPRDGPQREGGHGRPERTHHPVAGRDVVRRRRARARGIHLAAPDRRGHDVTGTHRGQDRAALQGPHGPRARRLARRRRGRQPAQRHPAARSSSAGVRKEYSDLREQRGQRQAAEERLPLADARRNRLTIDWSANRAGEPCSLGITVLDDYPLDELVEPDRLDPVLSDMGAGRALPGHPGRPTGRARRDESLPRRRGSARPDRPREAAHRAGGVRDLARGQRGRRHHALRRPGANPRRWR